MKKKVLALLLVLLVFASAACGSKDPNAGSETTTDENNSASEEYQYMTDKELQDIINNKDSAYLVVDVRKKADYDKEHVVSSVSADVDSAVNGDDGDATANLEKIKKDAADGTKYVLLCYSGNKYAQNATRILQSMGVSGSDIYTLEGGYKKWGDDKLLVTGSDPGELSK